MKKYITVFAILIILTSCEEEDNNNESNGWIDKELIGELISKSYDTLEVDSNTFVLDAFLWRNFMPITELGGEPMISINWLREIDSNYIPDNIDLIEQYVINNDSIWISDFENESRPPQPDYMIEKISRDGPKWGPEIYVDVISKVYNSAKDEAYYIRKENVYIVRTE